MQTGSSPCGAEFVIAEQRTGRRVTRLDQRVDVRSVQCRSCGHTASVPARPARRWEGGRIRQGDARPVRRASPASSSAEAGLLVLLHLGRASSCISWPASSRASAVASSAWSAAAPTSAAASSAARDRGITRRFDGLARRFGGLIGALLCRIHAGVGLGFGRGVRALRRPFPSSSRSAASVAARAAAASQRALSVSMVSLLRAGRCCLDRGAHPPRSGQRAVSPET